MKPALRLTEALLFTYLSLPTVSARAQVPRKWL